MARATQLATMPDPPKLISGRSGPWSAAAHVHAHVDEGLAPIQMPMPMATRAGIEAVELDAWRPMAKARWTSRRTGRSGQHPKPSSSAITASRKSVCASGR